MVARLLTPWGVLFDGLEQAHNDDIALLRVEPDAQRGRLLLGGEARNMGALVGYVAALEGHGGLSDVRLVNQQIKADDAQHPLEFALEARWQGAAAAPSAQGVE